MQFQHEPDEYINNLMEYRALEELIAEFNEMSGTRYAREVTEVLSEPDVREAVREIITAQREEVNYQIYAFNHYKL